MRNHTKDVKTFPYALKRLAIHVAAIVSSFVLVQVTPQSTVGQSLCATNYCINWWTIDSGGGTSSGEGYTLIGTVGQPDAGPALSGGSYSLRGGFWTDMASQAGAPPAVAAPEPQPTETSIPPTAAPAAPTAASIPPTMAPAAPPANPIQPTATSVPPPATSVPAPATAIPPAATPTSISPSPTPFIFNPAPQSSGTMLGISTRGKVETGGGVMIGGIIVENGQTQVIVRAKGPSMGLPPFNVPGTLQNPLLELYSGSNIIASNDDWQSGNCTSVLGAQQPTDPRESCIIMTLNPGAYTAIVRGADGTSGVGLVEVYSYR